MKHLFVIFIVICVLFPFLYNGPTEITLHGVVFERDWFIRDELVFAGYGISPCVIFIKDRSVAKKIAIAFIIQAITLMFSKWWDDMQYDMLSTTIQGIALAGSIVYIYYKTKPNGAKAK